MTLQRLTILGSTGSIGTSTLDVVSRHPHRFEVFALTAQGRGALAHRREGGVDRAHGGRDLAHRGDVAREGGTHGALEVCRERGPRGVERGERAESCALGGGGFLIGRGAVRTDPFEHVGGALGPGLRGGRQRLRLLRDHLALGPGRGAPTRPPSGFPSAWVHSSKPRSRYASSASETSECTSASLAPRMNVGSESSFFERGVAGSSSYHPLAMLVA